MMVFHGSAEIVRNPDVGHSYRMLDFGAGFYVATVREQAERWARRKAAVFGKDKAVINIYQMDDYTQGLRIKEFDEDLTGCLYLNLLTRCNIWMKKHWKTYIRKTWKKELLQGLQKSGACLWKQPWIFIITAGWLTGFMMGQKASSILITRFWLRYYAKQKTNCLLTSAPRYYRITGAGMNIHSIFFQLS